MSAEDLYYQAVLFFFLGDRVIGSMGLFHTKEEGGFREEERGLLEYLAELVRPTTRTISATAGRPGSMTASSSFSKT